MAAQKTQAGTITRETMIPIQRIGVLTSTTVTKGNVCQVQENGYLEPAGTGDTGPFYVALETVVNAGASGSVDCPVAVPGHYVTVIAETAATILPGKGVIVGSDLGKVITAANDAAANTVVGWFNAEEGGVVSKAGTTPYLESQSDTEEFNRVAVSADDAVIEIRLGAY